ncbi:hypothetical protein CVT24_012512 [Panaeolus cyanescens]|uniref:WH1 domain-containing protein n=1 Tax=Panaeolus cyanescens TaxID=181874 RepID=A0A409YK17_9AGAR|nr:hypothetical protein CVT24_012512 [Panaeolus cyanescens]
MSSSDSFSLVNGNTRPLERNGITGLEQNPYTVLVSADARVYHTNLKEKDTQQWNYTRWKGRLTFGRDLDTPLTAAQGLTEAEKYWFRLADVETGRTVWMFKFPEHFEYVLDRPFFHVFQGRTRKYGFLFNDDDEASAFGSKVISQLYGAVEAPKKAKRSASTRSKSISVSRSMISGPAPESFKHVAHIGVSKEGVFEASKELDDGWKAMLESLQGHVSVDVLRRAEESDGEMSDASVYGRERRAWKIHNPGPPIAI